MTDCSNAEIRDMLPDYLHEQLSVADHALVQQHLVSCVECADELALLRTVFALRPQTTAPNIADILAKLPKPGQQGVPFIPVAPAAVADGVRDINSARSVARKTGNTSNLRAWRAVAAVAVMAVGVLTLKVANDNAASADLVPMNDSATVAGLQSRMAGGSDNLLRDSANSPSAVRGIALSVGDPAAYSDDELEDMMARLDKWDGAASADPLPGVPILPPGS